MLSPHLIRQVEQHPEKLPQGLAEGLLQHPGTTAYPHPAPAQLLPPARDLYERLGDWLAGRSHAEVDARFGPRGADRFAEGVPIEEVVLALILSKRHLRHHMKQASALASAAEIHAEMEVDKMVSAFYDKVPYAMVRGYEAARRDAAQPRKHGTPLLGAMKPGNIGWVP